jgi:2-polyprenyl-6-methoxyphenol hydroxylase-like FAD-dependent oxidoreductase
VLESLLPGISAELRAGGAQSSDITQDVCWFMEGATLQRFPSGLEGVGMSRAFLERVVRRRVRSLPNVRLRGQTRIDELLVCADRRRVVGVRSGSERFEAEFVVDATGRGSRSPHWLEAIGYTAPVKEAVGIELRYTTRRFRRHPADLHGTNAVVIPPTPQGKRGGVIVREENDQWTVTLLTHFGEFPPPELAGFIDFARTLPLTTIFDVIRNAEPLGDAQTIRFPASIRHRYEGLKRFPAGYLVVGDAISSFNPIYGQGMSVAALEAAALSAALDGGLHDLPRRFFRRAATIVDAAWSISTGNDFRMPETTGRRTAAVTLINWYVARLLAAGHHDPAPVRAFFKVSNLLAKPSSLLRPSVIWNVVRSAQHERRFPRGDLAGTVASNRPT